MLTNKLRIKTDSEQPCNDVYLYVYLRPEDLHLRLHVYSFSDLLSEALISFPKEALEIHVFMGREVSRGSVEGCVFTAFVSLQAVFYWKPHWPGPGWLYMHEARDEGRPLPPA